MSNQAQLCDSSDNQSIEIVMHQIVIANPAVSNKRRVRESVNFKKPRRFNSLSILKKNLNAVDIAKAIHKSVLAFVQTKELKQG